MEPKIINTKKLLANYPMVKAAEEFNPLHLVNTALEKGIEPDKLGRLIDLAESWKRNRAEEAFAADMNLCQAEIDAVPKDAYNKQTESYYARLEKMLEIAKPKIGKHGFSLCFFEEKCELADHIRVCLTVSHKGGHSKTIGAFFPKEGKGIKGNVNMTPMHAHVSELSYAQRTLVKMFFNIAADGGDNDGNGSAELLSTEQTEVLNQLFENLRAVKYEPSTQAFWDFVHGEDKTQKRMPEMLAKDFSRVVADLMHTHRRATKDYWEQKKAGAK